MVGVVADAASGKKHAVVVEVGRQKHGSGTLAKVQSVAACVERQAAVGAQRFERLESASDEVREHIAARNNHALEHSGLDEPFANNHR